MCMDGLTDQQVMAYMKQYLDKIENKNKIIPIAEIKGDNPLVKKEAPKKKRKTKQEKESEAKKMAVHAKRVEQGRKLAAMNKAKKEAKNNVK